MPDQLLLPLTEWLSREEWPLADLLPEDLQDVYLTPPQLDSTGEAVIGILLTKGLSLRIPGLDILTLAFGPAGATEFDLALRMSPFRLRAHVPAVLRVNANILRPLREGTKEPDLEASALDIDLGGIDFKIEGGGPELDLSGVVAIPRCMVGTTGVILEIGKLRWLTPSTPQDQRPTNTPPGFTGLYLDDVTVEIPQLPAAAGALRMDDVFLGTGGFSGKISRPGLALGWEDGDFTGEIHGELFGFKGGISSLAVEFRQNALVSCEIEGDIFVPYLDRRVGLTLGLDGSGGLTATAGRPHSTPTETAVTEGGPGYLVHLDIGGFLALDVSALRFEAPTGGPARLGISGRVALTNSVLELPPIELSGLRIDSRGHVYIEGGWLPLSRQYGVNFHGFRLEIAQLGFGEAEGGGKWIGFSGGLKLAEGLPAGASVEGLRVTWYGERPPSITFNGVSVAFTVPDVLSFQGSVSYTGGQQVSTPAGLETVHRFDGAISLDLTAINMRADAKLVFGSADGARGSYNFFAIYLGVELPAGIPLWSSGLAVYGMAGLFAYQLEPNKRPDEGWFENPDGDPGWYKRGEPGVTDLKTKWDPRPGSLALGAGVTIGTLADNGFAFSGKFLLAIVFPGPILLLEGKADLLRKRSELDKPGQVVREPLLRSLAVIDGRAGTFTFGLDAQYKEKTKGELVDIHGGAEAFFDFHRGDAWHLYLGRKEPRARRTRAELFRLFEVDSYLELDAHRLALGAWVGYDRSWQYGPLDVALQAWIEANSVINFQPVHFSGDLWLHGLVRLSAFGFGIGLSADARIAADAPDPFHVRGEFHVNLDLPWPLPDQSKDIVLEWDAVGTPPPLPLPLKDVAVEHFKVTTSWPLPRTGENPLLVPDYDRGDGFLRDDLPTPAAAAPPPADASTVPLDGRVHLTFGRPVHDDAQVGVNLKPVLPDARPEPGWERVGDPTQERGPVRVRYALERLELHKYVGGSWVAVAKSPAAAGERKLYGSWAPVPQLPDGGGENPGQVKLWLWSKTPFDYTRHAGRAYDEWYVGRFDPLPPPSDGTPVQSLICCDFGQFKPGQWLPTPWTHPTQPGIQFEWFEGANIVQRMEGGRSFAQVWRHFTVTLSEPAQVVTIDFVPPNGLDLRGEGWDAAGKSFGPFDRRDDQAESFEVSGDDLVKVRFSWNLRPWATGGIYYSRRSQVVPRAVASSGGADPTIWFAARDGSSDTQITAGAWPRLAPGGRYLAFLRGPDPDPTRNHIWVRDLQTGAEWLVFNNDDFVVNFDWSADGDRIIFDYFADIYQANRDGTGFRMLVAGPGSFDDAPVVNPFDGTLAFHNTNPAEAGCLLLADADGGNRRPIPNTVGAVWPSWSPDGQFLTFARGPDISANFLDLNSYWRIKPDGTDLIQLAVLSPGNTFGPGRSWTPDGSQLVVPGRIDGVHGLFGIATDGSQGITRLMASEASAPPEFVGSVTESAADYIYLAKLCFVTRVTKEHFTDELARWSQEGEVLEADTDYRFQVATRVTAVGEGELAGYRREVPLIEYAYFRTGGPPGLVDLSIPRGHPNPAEFRSAIDDLTRYVRQTVPATVPVPGQAAVLPRNVYRAYDVGVEFNENYVDLMYRIARRDLGLSFFDTNGRPARDVRGRIVAPANRWGHVEALTLTEGELRWIGIVNESDRARIDPAVIVRDARVIADTQGQVLDGSTLFEARLVPLLLHEDFAAYPAGAWAAGPAGSLGRWVVRDESGGPSRWEIGEAGTPPSRHVAQTADAVSVLVLGGGPGHPDAWDNYRLSAYLRTTGSGPLGVTFRDQGAGQHYRFTVDRGAGIRRLEKHVGGAVAVLAEEAFPLDPDRDYRITVEAIGSSIKVDLDGVPVFDCDDDAIRTGGIGLYGSAGSRFSDLRVDDFRPVVPAAYKFRFVTSRFTNFLHHLHSYRDEARPVELPADVDLGPASSAAVPPEGRPTDAEARAYRALVPLVPDIGTTPVPTEVEIYRIERGGTMSALLLRSSEPIDWERTALTAFRADRFEEHPIPPRTLKLIDVDFGSTGPGSQSVTLLLRETAVLTGLRVEYRPLGLTQDSAWTLLYTFGVEAVLAAGTRVILGPGGSEENPRIVRRALAVGGPPLPAEGADFRLVAPDSAVLHARAFLPASAYTSLAVRVLRDADGTGLFILPTASGGMLGASRYRLMLTYRRDNTSIDPSSRILTEAGDQSSELVWLDIP